MKKKAKIIILAGAPASGKSMASDYLMSYLEERGLASKTKSISAGDLLRQEVSANTDLGKEIDALIRQGTFVSAEIIRRLLLEHLNALEEFEFMLLDGFPRSLEQLDYVSEFFGFENIVLVYINTPENELLARVSLRRLCVDCGYSHRLMPDGKCPKCGGDVKKRDDDAIIEKRLRIYKEITLPVIEEMRSMVPVYEVNGLFEDPRNVENLKDFADEIFEI